jgi:hypothetical protein
MATRTTKNEVGFVDKRWTQLALSPSVSASFMQQNGDVAACRTRLAAISASYTAARLDQMTLNDMLYAIRLSDEAASV